MQAPVGSKGNTVEHGESTAIERISRHKGLGQVVETGAIDDHTRPANGIDERPPRRIAKHKGLPAFGGIHKGLPDISMDHQPPTFHDLRQLILGGSMDDHLGAVQT